MINNKIPKIIHYCWFGGNEKPDIIKKCIDSWKKYCPDWEIIEWNENNFDVTKYKFTKEAYEMKKWAFVSDMARLLILYEYGGVYLDTDVELLTPNPLDKYLSNSCLLSFENERVINSGAILMCDKSNKLIDLMLDSYKKFDSSKNKYQTNTEMNNNAIISFFPDLKYNGKTQIFQNGIIISPSEYNQNMKHHGTRTWIDLPKYTVTKNNKFKIFLRNPNIFSFLENNKLLKKIVPIYTFLVYDFLDMGLFFYIKYNFKKLKNKLKKKK